MYDIVLTEQYKTTMLNRIDDPPLCIGGDKYSQCEEPEWDPFSQFCKYHNPSYTD